MAANRAVTRRVRCTSFNPIIVSRGATDEEEREGNNSNGHHRRGYEINYDDGSGSGIRPLPDSVSEILIGPRFKRLLEQLRQLEASSNDAAGRSLNLPASKSSIESLPKILILDRHVIACAVCTEVFVVGTEGCEMPCKHIFHRDCIVPWLVIRNSCPVCRLELLPESMIRWSNEEERVVGMTIWRLSGDVERIDDVVTDM